MKRGKIFPYGKQTITEEDIEAVASALRQDWITRGPIVEQFEEAFAHFCGAKYAVSFSSATAALMAASYAAKIGPFDKVVTTPNTFAATIVGAIHAKARIELVDIQRDNGCMDQELLQGKLNYLSTRGKLVIIPVHFAGIAEDIVKINDSLADPEAVIIEDAAHALGSRYPNGEMVGCCSNSDMTIFSFHAVKNITTGEGGMVTANNPLYREHLLRFRNNGIEREEESWPGNYRVVDATGNYHMTDFQAALGLSQIKRIDRIAAKRRSLVRAYRDFLKKIPDIELFSDRYDSNASFHLQVTQIDFAAYGTERKKIMEQLAAKGINTQVHYKPLYRQPFYQKREGVNTATYPQMEKYYSRALTLPLFYDLTVDEVGYICESLRGSLIG